MDVDICSIKYNQQIIKYNRLKNVAILAWFKTAEVIYV